MRDHLLLPAVLFLAAGLFAFADPATTPAPSAAPRYAIVVSQATLADPGWAAVVGALQERHPQARVFAWSGAPADLSAWHPRHTAFVATPAESTRAFVAEVSRLCRRLNPDPYTDTCWGIVTGFDAGNALEMARCPGFTVQSVSGNTAFESRCVPGGGWFDELKAGLAVVVKPNGAVERREGSPDSTAGIVAALRDCDLFITSSHGTERDLQLGYSYRNGQIRSKAGELTGKDLEGNALAVESSRDKAWLPVGNCLLGHIDGPDAFALAMLRDARVRAFAGYTVETWYGYAGWGLLDYFVEQPGRYTYAEAVWANRLALEHRLYTAWPQAAELNPAPGQRPSLGEPATPSAGLKRSDGRGLLHDRDVLAFYGDPAAQVVMPPKWRAYEQTLSEAKADPGSTAWTLTVTGNAGADSFATVNTNGSQRGGRPIVQFLPRAIDPATVKVTEGADLQPVFGPNWILVPRRASYTDGQSFVVRFSANDAT